MIEATGLALVLTVVIGYLLGSIPVAVLVARARGVDIRAVGDRNPGYWNAKESLGRRAAVPVFVGELEHCSEPEFLADDRGGLDHGSLARPELVEPGGEHGLDRGWEGKLLRGLAAFHGHPHELLDEERIAPGSFDDACAIRGRDRRLGGDALDQRRALVVRERLERHRGGIRLAAAPARPPVEQLRASEADQ